MLRISLFLATLLLTASTYATVIELDNQNAEHCRQQILSSKDTNPVILFYMHDCPYANKFRPAYEKAAKDSPNRAFFAFNFRDYKHPQMDYTQVAQDCLGQTVFVSPRVSVYDLEEDESGKPMIYRELKLGLNQAATTTDIMKFIKMDYQSKLDALTLANN